MKHTSIRTACLQRVSLPPVLGSEKARRVARSKGDEFGLAGWPGEARCIEDGDPRQVNSLPTGPGARHENQNVGGDGLTAGSVLRHGCWSGAAKGGWNGDGRAIEIWKGEIRLPYMYRLAQSCRCSEQLMRLHVRWCGCASAGNDTAVVM